MAGFLHDNVLFQEIMKVLLEYGFVHPWLLAMPKNKVGFIIASFEGLRVDWPLFTTDSLRIAIAVVADGKKSWTGVTQWFDHPCITTTRHQAQKERKNINDCLPSIPPVGLKKSPNAQKCPMPL